jgi:mRNA interferase HicA
VNLPVAPSGFLTISREHLHEIFRIRRWLKKQGCTFETREVGTSHLIVKYKGKETSFPMHGSKEIGTGLVQAIKKQLGLK